MNATRASSWHVVLLLAVLLISAGFTLFGAVVVGVVLPDRSTATPDTVGPLPAAVVMSSDGSSLTIAGESMFINSDMPAPPASMRPGSPAFGTGLAILVGGLMLSVGVLGLMADRARTPDPCRVVRAVSGGVSSAQEPLGGT